MNQIPQPLTGFQTKAVSGYVPSFVFSIASATDFPHHRHHSPFRQLDYLPEPDIFHDVAGHVPMHTDKNFAQALVRFGAVRAHGR